MRAASERAKMIERHRRGTRPAARAGTVHVRSGAPSGSRDLPTSEGPGHARDEAGPDAARGVRRVFDGVGRARVTIGEGWRRLTPAGEGTRTGKTIGERRVVWGMVKNPA
jgi:site-specific DNA recombinase